MHDHVHVTNKCPFSVDMIMHTLACMYCDARTLPVGAQPCDALVVQEEGRGHTHGQLDGGQVQQRGQPRTVTRGQGGRELGGLEERVLQDQTDISLGHSQMCRDLECVGERATKMVLLMISNFLGGCRTGWVRRHRCRRRSWPAAPAARTAAAAGEGP